MVAVMTKSNSDQFHAHRFVVDEPSFQNVLLDDFYDKQNKRYSQEKAKIMICRAKYAAYGITVRQCTASLCVV